MDNIDIKLLRVFDEIRRTRSVSLAAERMGMSQSTMSFCLGKLRELFGDLLFVRSSEGMVPTARARQLEGQVTHALAAMQALLEPPGFSPAESNRMYRLGMTDISHIVVLARVLQPLLADAPGMRVEVLRISGDTPALMERGEADLSIGFMPQLDAGFYRQRLFTQDFVCVAAARHPRVCGRLTREDFVREGHIDVPPSTTSQLIVEKALRRARIERRVVLRMPTYLGLASVIASTELVATVPRLLGEILADQDGLSVFEPPIDIPSYAVNQYWHARFHQEPGHMWLRQRIAEMLAEGVEAEKSRNVNSG